MLQNGLGSPPLWPDDAVRAVAALEQASHESLSSDYQKYNQKMRQLCFNLKVNMIYQDHSYNLRLVFSR